MDLAMPVGMRDFKRDKYYEILEPEVSKRYSAHHAVFLFLRNRHYGPWEESEQLPESLLAEIGKDRLGSLNPIIAMGAPGSDVLCYSSGDTPLIDFFNWYSTLTRYCRRPTSPTMRTPAAIQACSSTAALKGGIPASTGLQRMPPTISLFQPSLFQSRSPW